MAIGPIGRPEPRPSLPTAGAIGVARPAAPLVTPRVADTHAAAYQPSTIVRRTFAIIRIDASNMVSVKVVDAETDEVLIEAPPSGMASLSDAMKQLTAALVPATE